MNILTFDIEDWYCHDNYSQDLDWKKHEVRIYEPLNKILDTLDETNTKGTFFCLGWLAENHPKVIRNITERGHQIGCHSFQHQIAYRLDAKHFFEDTRKAKLLLEDIAGKEITAYRAPSFSITSQNPYAFDVLAQLGFTHDCSVFPTARDFGGFEEYGEAKPAIITHNGFSIKEFPMNTISIMGKNIVFSGGGYFRIIPYSMIKLFVKNSDYIVSYFHPSDFDPEQPNMNYLPLMRQIKNKIGLKGAFNKFRKYISDHEFVNVSQADTITDWSNTRILTLNQ